MLKFIAKQVAVNVTGAVIAVATLAAIGYVASAVHNRNCTNEDCPGPGICAK